MSRIQIEKDTHREGIRPAARTTCVKPTGTTSLIFSTSSSMLTDCKSFEFPKFDKAQSLLKQINYTSRYIQVKYRLGKFQNRKSKVVLSDKDKDKDKEI